MVRGTFRRSAISALVVFLAALPAALAAQRPQGPGGGPALQQLQRNPIQVVLDARGELGLSAAQVARLESVRARLQEQNGPSLARIDSLQRTLPPTSAANRDAMQAVMERIRPLRQAVQENNRRALDSIRPHLSDAQWARVNELTQPRRRVDPGR
jgi:hypothetical protein